MAAVRFAVGALAEAAQTPRAKGGLLPVDTGFLRNSFTSSIGQAPGGPGKPGAGNLANWYGSALALTLARAEPGDVIYLGWTAKYARPMEARYGFAKTGAMNWQAYVDEGIRRAKAANP